MIPALLFLFLLSVTHVSLSVPTTTQNQIRETENVSEFIQTPEADSLSIEFGDIAVRKGSVKNADPCTAEGCKWPKVGSEVHVPYLISPKYTHEGRLVILKALESFHKKTCVRFIPVTSKDLNYISFEPKKGCWSFLGRQGGAQAISLADGCVHFGTVQHEVLHALGFHHEQSRSDRDAHVWIYTQNIEPGKEGNFDKAQTNNLGTPYDFTSIMQYGKYDFSKNHKPTIVAKANPSYDWGEAKQMNIKDFIRVNKLYKC